LFEVQREADKILRTSHEIEKGFILNELENRLSEEEHLSHLLHSPEERGGKPRRQPADVAHPSLWLNLFAFRALKKVKHQARHRDLEFHLEGRRDLSVAVDALILRDVFTGLLKNAVENTPDGGRIRIILRKSNDHALIMLEDSGVGISEDNQKSIFEGFFHTIDTELYTSKRSYDFGAGGKGLDLFRMKLYGQRFGFDITVKSQRCTHLPEDGDICPGSVHACPHCSQAGDCIGNGGSVFSVAIPISESVIHLK
jgi:signal transduction histidine kinase